MIFSFQFFLKHRGTFSLYLLGSYLSKASFITLLLCITPLFIESMERAANQSVDFSQEKGSLTCSLSAEEFNPIAWMLSPDNKILCLQTPKTIFLVYAQALLATQPLASLEVYLAFLHLLLKTSYHTRLLELLSENNENLHPDRFPQNDSPLLSLENSNEHASFPLLSPLLPMENAPLQPLYSPMWGQNNTSSAHVTSMMVECSESDTARICARYQKILQYLLIDQEATFNKAVLEDLLIETEQETFLTRKINASLAHYLIAVCTGFTYCLKDHTSSLCTAVFNPTSTLLLTSFLNGKTCIWNASTLERIALFSKPQKAISAVAWNNDSSLIVTGSEDGTTRVWNSANGTQIAETLQDSAISLVAFNNTDKTISILTSDGKVYRWEFQKIPLSALSLRRKSYINSL